MRNRKLIVIILATVLCFSLTSAWAGSKERHRWEGTAIGAGAVILGAALFNACFYSQPSPPPVVYTPLVYHSVPPIRVYGYWKPWKGPHKHHDTYDTHWKSRNKNRDGHWKSHRSNRHEHRNPRRHRN